MTRALPLLTALLVALVASPAQAITGPLKTVLETSLEAPAGTTSTPCHDGLRPGAPGVATQKAYPAGIGAVDIALDGREGDWDVAVFDSAGALVAGDASPDAQESAGGWLRTPGAVTVQACRLSGDAPSVPTTLRLATFEGDLAARIAAAKADPPQLVDVATPTREDKERLQRLDVDLTEHGSATSLGVVLRGEADREALRKAGFTWRVKVPDLVASDLAARRAETSRSTTRALPSGERTTYRRLVDYNAEMKKLAEDNPGLVKLLTLPNKTWMGKDVLGLEISADVANAGHKPVFFNMGVHHAREWPAGEHPMEWAYELVNGVKAGNERIKRIVEGSSNIVVPIINPDGFEASREAGQRSGAAGGRPQAVDDTAYLVAGAGNGGEYRRKNCRSPDDSESGNCFTSAGLAEPGVDPNRNYGGLWGGPGATNDITSQTYYGPGPFSEPETRNVKAVVGSRSVVTLITNHTTAGLALRAPGLASLGDPVDENRGYKALGDDMAKENGYFSQKSFELYDTTGTTEDWTYNTAGGYGFTFEIYCGAPNYETGDCDDPAFHPEYKLGVIDEYEGLSDQADHETDPGRSETAPFGNVVKYDGKGNREAYLIAAESTLNEARHSVIEGKAPAGTTLRIKKTFKTETFPQEQEGGGEPKPMLFDDSLEQTIVVGQSGAFRWHTNPSTRPIVAKARGEEGATGTPSPEETRSGTPAGAADDPENDGAAPSGSATCAASPACNNHPFTVPANDGNRRLKVRAQWATIASDWDMEVFRDTNANKLVDAGEPVVSVSQQGTTDFEEITTPSQPGAYIARLTNFAATEPYTLTITHLGPEPFRPAQVEAWTLTCEKDGKVLETQQVIVDRGGKAAVTLGGCEKALAGTPAAPAPPASKPCSAGSGLATAGVTPSGRGARLSFSRRLQRPVTVSVFQQSRGRQVTGERLVARFSGRTSAVRWNGRANRPGRTVTDGIYFVRYTMRLADGSTDALRVTLLRRNGKFSRLASFYRRASCDALPSFKLERPVFGGRTNRALNISFRVADPARVTVTVLKGQRVVKRFGPTQRRAGVTHRLRLDSSKLARGTYTVRIQVPGAKPVTATLVARRI